MSREKNALDKDIDIEKDIIDVDDNARAREEIKNRALDLNREEPNNPVPAMSVEAVEDDPLQANNTLSLPISSFLGTPKSSEKSIGSRAIAFAEKEFGRLLSQTEAEGISDFCHEFSERNSHDPDAIVIEAIKRCVNERQNKLSYLKGIINNWLSHDVTDLSDIAQRDAEWSSIKNKKMSKGASRNAKNLGTHGNRYSDSSAYDPNEWAAAGYAVSFPK
jgi:DnaD/phage-associated family protein